MADTQSGLGRRLRVLSWAPQAASATLSGQTAVRLLYIHRTGGSASKWVGFSWSYSTPFRLHFVPASRLPERDLGPA